MTIKDLPEGKIAVVIELNDAWRGHCIYRLGGSVYFVGMSKDVELIADIYNDIRVRPIGDLNLCSF